MPGQKVRRNSIKHGRCTRPIGKVAEKDSDKDQTGYDLEG